jgi:hypothetical protein
MQHGVIMDPTINAVIMFVTLSRFWIIITSKSLSPGGLEAMVNSENDNTIITHVKITQMAHTAFKSFRFMLATLT